MSILQYFAVLRKLQRMNKTAQYWFLYNSAFHDVAVCRLLQSEIRMARWEITQREFAMLVALKSETLADKELH